MIILNNFLTSEFCCERQKEKAEKQNPENRQVQVIILRSFWLLSSIKEGEKQKEEGRKSKWLFYEVSNFRVLQRKVESGIQKAESSSDWFMKFLTSESRGGRQKAKISSDCSMTFSIFEVRNERWKAEDRKAKVSLVHKFLLWLQNGSNNGGMNITGGPNA